MSLGKILVGLSYRIKDLGQSLCAHKNKGIYYIPAPKKTKLYPYELNDAPIPSSYVCPDCGKVWPYSPTE
jgi:hypothetical protein